MLKNLMIPLYTKQNNHQLLENATSELKLDNSDSNILTLSYLQSSVLMNVSPA